MVFRKPRLLLIMLGTLAILALGALFALDGYLEHQRRLSALTEQLRMEAKLLSEHARLSFAAADLVLTEIETTAKRTGLHALANSRDYWESFRELVARTPQLGAVNIADAEGTVRFSTAVFPAPAGVNIGNRELFIAHRQGQQRFIGKSAVDRTTRRQFIPVSIRLNDPEGAFNGAIISTLDTSYFKNVYTEMAVNSDLRIGIFRVDGTALSLPSGMNASPVALQPFAFGAGLQVGDGDWHSFVGSSEETRRIVAQQRVEGYPILVSASYDYYALVRSLYPTWAFTGLIFLAFAAAIVLSIVFLNRTMRTVDQEREMQLALARRQREAERLSHAIISNFPNGRVLIYDKELRNVFADGQPFDNDPAYANDRMIGRTIHEIYPPRIRATLQALARNALAGMKSQGEIAGRMRIYKVIATPLKDDDGKIRSGLMLTHDITDLKVAQQELEVRNSELQELSLTDGLLGIANRRAFDQELMREWRRAARSQMPLSLLMVDVDHFKLYNDKYGHTNGDACLQRIAAVLEQSINRPGDVVARYGGEELTVLLPECDLQGALTVSERIHARLAEAAIPFPDSPLGTCITVSIGATSTIPHYDLPTRSLIEDADQALYRAKETGRHRTVASGATMFGEDPEIANPGS